MECKDFYIGAPNGVVVCVDHRVSGHTQGRLYHGYSKKGFAFSDIVEMIFIMEDFYNKLIFPFPGTNERVFIDREKTVNKERMIKVMEDKELLKRHGELGTFIVRVQYRQNSTWQGQVTWVDGNKTIGFRSVLELIKLLESAMADEDENERRQFAVEQ